MPSVLSLIIIYMVLIWLLQKAIAPPYKIEKEDDENDDITEDDLINMR